MVDHPSDSPDAPPPADADLDRIEAARQEALSRLLAARDPEVGSFVGELSTSALSTGTATMAFALAWRGSVEDGARDEQAETFARRGAAWLVAHQNADGGYGDTIHSPSNISTTTVCWSALTVAADIVGEPARAAARKAEAYVAAHVQEVCDAPIEPARLAEVIRARYGKDQTFSVPILTTCALAGLLDPERWKVGGTQSGGGRSDLRASWRHVPALPFECAAAPHQWFRWLRLRTVSYALPALIAMGQVRHHFRRPRTPGLAWLRDRLRGRTLRILREIQPRSGGYLEAAPLTSFVAMSLIGCGLRRHPVVEHGLRFLAETVRPDGSWPIDTNLDTWTTTLAVGALDPAPASGPIAEIFDHRTTTHWLLRQQYRTEHPFTRAAPGGWAWTDLSGGVPDGDDTPGALLALHRLQWTADEATRERIREAAALGADWLLDLQNTDGGIPTFCRGWGQLPFDRSSQDLTAHALRAWATWSDELPAALGARCRIAIRRGIRYLLKQQNEDGSWVPLWFGNQQLHPEQENPLYGTSRVLRAVATVRSDDHDLDAEWLEAGRRGVGWLLAHAQPDGSFVAGRHGDGRPVATSIEETALALEALASWRLAAPRPDPVAAAGTAPGPDVDAAVRAAASWLAGAIGGVGEGGTWFAPSPIGLYFAKLWYSERLYPVVFTLSALELALQAIRQQQDGSSLAGPSERWDVDDEGRVHSDGARRTGRSAGARGLAN